jgi:hypothetical protein
MCVHVCVRACVYVCVCVYVHIFHVNTIFFHKKKQVYCELNNELLLVFHIGVGTTLKDTKKLITALRDLCEEKKRRGGEGPQKEVEEEEGTARGEEVGVGGGRSRSGLVDFNPYLQQEEGLEERRGGEREEGSGGEGGRVTLWGGQGGVGVAGLSAREVYFSR